MPTNLDLSEKTLREKFYGIANEVGSPRLAEAAKSAGLDSIISGIIRENKAKPIIEKLLADFPEGDYISKSILQFKGGALKGVMKSFGDTIYFAAESYENMKEYFAAEDKEYRDMKEVAEALNQDEVIKLASNYKGKTLKKAIEAVLQQAYYHSVKSTKKAAEALNQDEVIKLTSNYKGKALKAVMEAISSTIFLIPDKKIVRKVVKLASNYKGKALEEVMETIDSVTFYALSDKRTMERAIETLNQEEMVKLVSNYKGKALEEVMRVIRDIIEIERAEDWRAVKKMAEILNQAPVIKIARSYKHRTLWETMIDDIIDVVCTPREKIIERVFNKHLAGRS